MTKKTRRTTTPETFQERLTSGKYTTSRAARAALATVDGTDEQKARLAKRVESYFGQLPKLVPAEPGDPATPLPKPKRTPRQPGWPNVIPALIELTGPMGNTRKLQRLLSACQANNILLDELAQTVDMIDRPPGPPEPEGGQPD